MTINKSDKVQIPTWLLIILTPIIISIVGAWVTIKIANAKNETSIEAIKRELTDVKAATTRIEIKLDNHITK